LCGESDRHVRGGALLAHRTGRAVEAVEIQGLDGVDHHHVGPAALVERGGDVSHAGCGGELHRRLSDLESKRAHADLVERFLAGDVEAGGRQPATCLYIRSEEHTSELQSLSYLVC